MNSTDRLYEEHKRKLLVSLKTKKVIEEELERILGLISKHLSKEENILKKLVVSINSIILYSSKLFEKGVSIPNDLLSYNINEKDVKKYFTKLQSAMNFIKNEEHTIKFLEKELLTDIENLKRTLEHTLREFDKDFRSIKESPVLQEEDKHLANEILPFFRQLNDHLDELLKTFYTVSEKINLLEKVYFEFEKSKTGKENFVYYNKFSLKELFVHSKEIVGSLEILIEKISSLHKFILKKEHTILKDILEYINKESRILKSKSERRMEEFFPGVA